MLKKTHLYLILSIIGFSCENRTKTPTDLNPIYSDFENAWEVRNLHGKVKELKIYKSNFQDTKPEKPTLNLVVNFTDFGALEQIDSYDNFGKLIQKDIFEYDSTEFLTKRISTNKRANSTYVLVMENDTINKTSTITATINDSIKQKSIVFYNENDYIYKQIAIEEKDTTVARHEYKFNKNAKIVLEVQYEKNRNNPIITNQYKYNEKGNVVWSSSKSQGMEFIMETEWREGGIVKETEYQILEDSIKQLDRITGYNKLFNPINLKIYEDSKLNRELKYNYEYDEDGNWIKRTVSMKEHFANSDKFIPIYIETRKIKYYD